MASFQSLDDLPPLWRTSSGQDPPVAATQSHRVLFCTWDRACLARINQPPSDLQWICTVWLHFARSQWAVSDLNSKRQIAVGTNRPQQTRPQHKTTTTHKQKTQPQTHNHEDTTHNHKHTTTNPITQPQAHNHKDTTHNRNTHNHSTKPQSQTHNHKHTTTTHMPTLCTSHLSS